MKTLFKLQDIPVFTRPARYKVTVGWDFLEHHLEGWNDRSIDGCLGLNLNPDFQRGHVWTEDKQIAYVEFCIKGGTSSRELLFNMPNWGGSYIGEMVIVDGKQRLEAVRKFLRNELPIFNGHYLNDFEPRLLKRSDCYFLMSVNNLKTRKELLQWYLDLNSGGVIHTSEEIEKVKNLLKEEK